MSQLICQIKQKQRFIAYSKIHLCVDYVVVRGLLLMGNYYGRGQKQEKLEEDQYIAAAVTIGEREESETKENFCGQVPRPSVALSRSFQVKFY